MFLKAKKFWSFVTGMAGCYISALQQGYCGTLGFRKACSGVP